MDFETLRENLQNGKVSCVQVLKAYQSQALKIHQKTNCITHFCEDALQAAEALDRIPVDDRMPLHGIPISLKEHIHLKGQDATLGLYKLLDNPAKSDANFVKLLKHLGAIPFCRTNLPQTCISFECSNPLFGSTTNILDSKRSPGGSSGGEATLIKGGGSILGVG